MLLYLLYEVTIYNLYSSSPDRLVWIQKLKLHTYNNNPVELETRDEYYKTDFAITQLLQHYG